MILEKALTTTDWLSAIGWTLIGIAFIKSIEYNNNNKFSLSYWMKNNIIDVIRGLLLTLVTMKLGSIVVDLLEIYLGFDFNKIRGAITEAGLSPVQFSLVLAIIFQYWLLKRKKKKKIEILSTVNPDKKNPNKKS